MVQRTLRMEKTETNYEKRDIKKIVSAFEKFENIEKYCHVADLAELEENEF